MDNNKTFSLTLSSKTMLTLVLAALPILGGGAYYGITLYNKMLSVINKFDYTKVVMLEEQLNDQRERYVELMQTNIRLQEKASEAIALAREAKAVSSGTSREVEASLSSIRSEVKSQIDGVNDKMRALQKATTNPLAK
jgi:hypothetical protein